MKHYDLVIVGGGLVGASLAIALKDTSLRIALIDARNMQLDDPRLFALNTSSCQFLENLNLWQPLMASAAAIKQVHVSYQKRFGSVRLMPADVGLETLGYVVPAACIEAVLHTTLHKLTNVDVLRPATVETLRQDDGMNVLSIRTKIKASDREVQLTSPIVIGADGTESIVRQQMQMPTEEIAYQQSAIVTQTKLAKAHQHIAYERFTEHGTIAMLPLPDNYCATIWSGDDNQIKTLMALDDAAFLQTLQATFGYRLGRLDSIAKRFVFPLRMVRAIHHHTPGVLLLGNAAHTLHPIAAQGFNLALYEVAVLVEQVLEKLATTGHFNPSDLADVAEKMAAQLNNSVSFSHRLATMVAGKSRFSSFTLQLGMLGINACLPIKKQFIQRMMGRTRCVPELLLNTSKMSVIG